MKTTTKMKKTQIEDDLRNENSLKNAPPGIRLYLNSWKLVHLDKYYSDFHSLYGTHSKLEPLDPGSRVQDLGSGSFNTTEQHLFSVHTTQFRTCILAQAYVLQSVTVSWRLAMKNWHERRCCSLLPSGWALPKIK